MGTLLCGYVKKLKTGGRETSLERTVASQAAENVDPNSFKNVEMERMDNLGGVM